MQSLITAVLWEWRTECTICDTTKTPHCTDCCRKGCLAAQLLNSRISSFTLRLPMLWIYASRLQTLLFPSTSSTSHKLFLLAKQPHHTEFPQSTKQHTLLSLPTSCSRQLTSGQHTVQGTGLHWTQAVLLPQSCNFSKKTLLYVWFHSWTYRH